MIKENYGEPDWKTLQELIIKRVYHEDNLLVQRTYALLTAHAFLTLAFVTSVTTKNMLNIAYTLTIVGMSVSLFQMAWGFRTHRMIRFWRIYLELVEKKANIPIDSLAFEFFDKNIANTPAGIIRGEGRTMNEIFPWRVIKSTTILVGVVLPFILIIFWAIALLVIPQYQLYAIISLAMIVIGIVIIGTIWGWQSAIPYNLEYTQKTGMKIDDSDFIANQKFFSQQEKQKLAEAGIIKCIDYQNFTRTRAGRRKLKKITDIRRDKILTWTNYLDLMRVDGITDEYAVLIKSVGVDTVKELSKRNPVHLHKTIEEHDISNINIINDKPTFEQVKSWVERAKRLPGMLEY